MLFNVKHGFLDRACQIIVEQDLGAQVPTAALPDRLGGTDGEGLSLGWLEHFSSSLTRF